MRWVIVAVAIVTVVVWFSGGTPPDSDIRHQDAAPPGAIQAAVPVRKPRAASSSTPVHVLVPASQPAPRTQPDERINDVAARPLPARRAPADYQALRREMLTTD